MVKERNSMDVEMTPSIIGEPDSKRKSESLSDTTLKSESLSRSSSTSNFEQEKDLCFTYFDGWNQEEQVQFIEEILGRMTHYQHGQINAFLKPMLQRDFISALPGRVMALLKLRDHINFFVVYFAVLVFMVALVRC